MAGGCVWQGGMCGGGHAWQRGHVWQGACMAEGGMHGEGVYLVGVCMVGGHAWQILRDTVNERAVHILLECILVLVCFR